jgi:N-acetylmuramoyl-L-alanine amidase
VRLDGTGTVAGMTTTGRSAGAAGRRWSHRSVPRPLRRGDSGPAVELVRDRLAALGLLAADPDATGRNVFDAACELAVREFQQARALTVDGVVGPETYRALDEARWRLGDRVLWLAITHPFVGDDVAELQHRLQELGFAPGRCDGVFGSSTELAVREFQRNVGLAPDGTCGPQTLKALDRLRRTVVGGRAQPIREVEELLRAGPTIAGKFVILDPGHGAGDRGSRHGGLDEATVVEDLTRRLEGRLAANGAHPFLTRGVAACPTDAERAAFANAAEGDLLLSLHCDAAPDPACNGAATYYFGSYGAAGRSHASTVGARLAGIVQEEVVARTGLLDCSAHPKTWDLLRLTRMPAVRLEIGYLTNPADAARLGSAQFRDLVADALLAAVARFYQPPDDDPQPARLRVPSAVG